MRLVDGPVFRQYEREVMPFFPIEGDPPERQCHVQMEKFGLKIVFLDVFESVIVGAEQLESVGK